MTMMQAKEWSVGAHQLRFEEPDLLLAGFQGPVRLADAHGLVEVFLEIAAKQPFFFCGDVSASSIDADARTYVSEHLSQEWMLGVAYVGAGAVQRAMGKALMLGLYFAGQVAIDIEFLPTEAHARASFAVKRQARAARVGAAPSP